MVETGSIMQRIGRRGLAWIRKPKTVEDRERRLGRAIAGTLAAVILLVLMLGGSCAFGLEPGLYGAGDDQGNGFSIHCNSGGTCQAIWFNHIDDQVEPDLIVPDTITVVNTSTETGGVWLWADPLCPRGLGACPVDLRLVSGSWNGTQGSFEFTEPVGSAVLDQVDRDTILVDFEVVRLRPNECDTGTGGLLFRRCISQRPVPYELIAGPPVE